MKKVVIDGIRYELNRKNRTATVLPLEYGQYSGDINIPSTIVHKRFLFKDITYSVVAIGMHAFGHCPNVTSITIPKSVNSIELAAFYACSSMKTLTLPNHVVFESTFFGSTYFQDCNSLQLINLTADSIEEFCAGSCNLELCSLLDWHEKGVRRKIIINNSEITKVILPDYLTIIKDGTFAYCHSLVEIIVPDKVTNIGWGAFAQCSALQSINIPQNVTTLGEGAFYGCSQLTQIIIPNSIKTIEKDIFAECTSLKKIILTAKSIEEYIQNNINHLLYNAKCHYIGRELVINDVVQTDIVIPSTISTLGDNLFYYCQSISTLTLSNTTTLGEDCLHGCTSLKTIKLEVGSIEEYCKNGRINLNLSRILTDNIEYKLLINGQEVTEITIPDGIYNRGGTHIFPFKNCSSITSIVLPTSLSDLPGGLSRIGGFHGCSSLKTLIIPKGFQKINSDAFKGCSSLESIVIPNTITGILLDSFSGCSSLKNIELPENLEFIGDYAFENCTSLVSITIPKNVKTIGKNAFKGCTALTSIHWNAKECTEIEWKEEKSRKNEWTPYGHTERIEYNYFYGPFANIAHQITTFTFGTDVECIPAYLCDDMIKLKSILIPHNVKKIGGLFCDHTLDKLTIPHHIVSQQEITDFMFRVDNTDIIVDDIETYCLKPMLSKTE
ncbi:MAG: leucine-rich repeat protein [Paludibacteraceae bacterium]|nr:leucine-rich repeat protein [Paludibacteraceae bacterium]